MSDMASLIKFAIRTGRTVSLISEEDIERFWTKVDVTDGCWTWTASKNKAGYGKFHVKNYPVFAHRFSFLINFGYLDGIVLHSCDNPSCVNPSHLTLGTHSQNTQDMIRKGRCNPPVGERCAQHVISFPIAREIRTLYATGEWTQRELADKFGVGRGVVWKVVTNKTWKE